MNEKSVDPSARRNNRRRKGRPGHAGARQSQSHSRPSQERAAAPSTPRKPDVEPTPLAELEGAFRALIEPIRQAVAEQGYRTPSPVQEQSIPLVLTGGDLIATAQTGTGKTAAFVLPILQTLHAAGAPAEARRPHVLILAPTRELAAQIAACVEDYGRHLNLRHAVIYGGVGQHPQVRALDRGVDLLIATPGRLLDLMNQGHVYLDRVSVFVLDEADRMLDMGFIPDIRRVCAKLPKQRQTLFLSATMPPEVRALSADMLRNPASVSIDPGTPAVERIDQCVLFVDRGDKQDVLNHIFAKADMDKVIVFTRTKHGANRVARKLAQAGVTAEAIHGDRSQGQRTRALDSFKRGQTRALVATDIAARGIDVDGITHVINFDLPEVAETYVHRIGRTARAGSDGDAISLCSAEERDMLRDIERFLRKELPVLLEHDHHSEAARNATGAAARPEKRGGGGGGGQRQGRQGGASGSKSRPRNHGPSQAGGGGGSSSGGGKRRSGSFASRRRGR